MLSIIWLFYGVPFAQDFSPSWMNSLEVNRLVKSSILVANEAKGFVSQIEARVLSRHIIKTAQCFDLDPILFTALIWRESHFRHFSQSETGAVGLTQLTKTGIREVLDRLAFESLRKKDDLRNQMTSCFPGWMKKIPKNAELADITEWKRNVAQSPELALIFGAVLLKSNLNRNYRTALEKYNGDPRIKERFANEVLILSAWISSSFMLIPQEYANNSKFLASIQGF